MYHLFDIIEKYGKDLIGINLLVNHFNHGDLRCDRLESLGRGCPKLQNLSLGFFNPGPGYGKGLSKLEFLSKTCKDLKDLKITNAYLPEFTSKSKVKEMFPNCNLELKNCGVKSHFDLDGEQIEFPYYGEDIEDQNGN